MWWALFLACGEEVDETVVEPWTGSGDCAVLGAVIEPGSYAYATRWDIRDEQLVIPEGDGFAVHRLGDAASTEMGAWHDLDTLGPVEVTFVEGEEVAVRTTRGVWWVTASGTPQEVGGVELPSLPRAESLSDLDDDLLSSDRVAAIVRSDSSFQVIDRRDPARPRAAAWIAPAEVESDLYLPPGAESIGACIHQDRLVRMHRARLASSVATVEVWDLSDPDAPRLQQRLELNGVAPHNLACDGERVLATAFREAVSARWAADGTLAEQARVWVIEPGVSNDEAPGVIDLWLDGDVAVVNERPFGWGDTLTTIDLDALDAGASWQDAHGPLRPGLVSGVVAAEGGVLWVWDTTTDPPSLGRIAIDDRSLADLPSVVVPVPAPAAAGPVLVRDGLAYVADGGTTRVYDVTDPSAPREVVVDDPSALDGVAAGWRAGERVLASRRGGVELLDLSDPLHPAGLATWSGDVRAVAATGFIGATDQGLVWVAVDGDALQEVPLGCLGFEDCSPFVQLALAADRLVVAAYDLEDGQIRLQSYALGPTGATLASASEPLQGWPSALFLDGDDVTAVVGGGADTELHTWSARDLEEGTSWPIPVQHAVFQLVDDQLLAAERSLWAWDIPEGSEAPSIDWSLRARDLAVWSDLAVITGGEVPLVTVDRSCQ